MVRGPFFCSSQIVIQQCFSRYYYGFILVARVHLRAQLDKRTLQSYSFGWKLHQIGTLILYFLTATQIDFVPILWRMLFTRWSKCPASVLWFCMAGTCSDTYRGVVTTLRILAYRFVYGCGDYVDIEWIVRNYQTTFSTIKYRRIRRRLEENNFLTAFFSVTNRLFESHTFPVRRLHIYRWKEMEFPTYLAPNGQLPSSCGVDALISPYSQMI